MFDIAPTELLLVAVVALLVIGPKDLPKAMRFVGQWVGKARAMTRHVRSGFDAMIREAELDEMQKKWAEENERIMREHPMSSFDPTAMLSPSDPPAELPSSEHALPSPAALSSVTDFQPEPEPRPLPHVEAVNSETPRP